MNAVPERDGEARRDKRNQAEQNGSKSGTLHGTLLRKAAALYQQRRQAGTEQVSIIRSASTSISHWIMDYCFEVLGPENNMLAIDYWYQE